MSEQHIVIVGGGFSGTALAVHLGRLGQAGLRVTLIEPRSQLAQGVAYSTADPAHRLNVPASRMQLAGDEEGSFDRWYRASDAYVSDPPRAGTMVMSILSAGSLPVGSMHSSRRHNVSRLSFWRICRIALWLSGMARSAPPPAHTLPPTLWSWPSVIPRRRCLAR